MRSLKNKKFISNVFYLAVIQFTNYILPLLTLPYLVRVLGIDKFGLLAFFTAFMYYFFVVIDYGFSLTATRDISLNRNKKDKISELFSVVLCIKILLTSGSAFLLLLLYFIFPFFNDEFEVLLFSFLGIVFQSLLPVWFFQGLETMKTITVLNTLSKFLYAVCVFLFVTTPSDYFLVPLFTMIGFFVSCCFSYYIIIKKFSVVIFIPSKSIVCELFSKGWYVFLSQIKTTIFSSTNIVILGLLSGVTAVGIFSSAEKLIRAIATLQTPITTALFPLIAIEINKNKNKAIIKLKKFLIYGSIIYLFFLVFLFTFSKEIIVFIYSDLLLDSVWVFETLLIIPLFIFINNILGTQILLNTGREKVFFLALLCIAVFSFFLCFSLTFYFSYKGTAISLLITEFIIVFVFMLLTRKELLN